MELYKFYILLCLTWRLDCDYYLGLYIGQLRPITDLSCWQKHVSLYHVLGPTFYAILWRQITTFSVSVMELFGTLWNFLMCLMERNNYGSNQERKIASYCAVISSSWVNGSLAMTRDPLTHFHLCSRSRESNAPTTTLRYTQPSRPEPCVL